MLSYFFKLRLLTTKAGNVLERVHEHYQLSPLNVWCVSLSVVGGIDHTCVCVSVGGDNGRQLMTTFSEMDIKHTTNQREASVDKCMTLM